MISQDDYRRFVQPFIRERNVRKSIIRSIILMGGSMHHLPALLEIEELNAIQWTPGLGEPQGGSRSGTIYIRRYWQEAKERNGLLGDSEELETFVGPYRDRRECIWKWISTMRGKWSRQ